jgi:hypothetical protein
MKFNVITFVIAFITWSIAVFIGGYITGREDTYREAYENGLMIMSRDNGKKVYRWIETHKIGYDYE